MPVQTVFANLESGMSVQEITETYDISAKEIRSAIRFVVESRRLVKDTPTSRAPNRSRYDRNHFNPRDRFEDACDPAGDLNRHGQVLVEKIRARRVSSEPRDLGRKSLDTAGVLHAIQHMDSPSHPHGQRRTVALDFHIAPGLDVQSKNLSAAKPGLEAWLLNTLQVSLVRWRIQPQIAQVSDMG